MKSIDPTSISAGELHGYLLSGVAPRPIAFASTMDEEGRPNLAPFSYFNVFSANPPVLIFSPARRGRDNTTKHTYENVKRVPEVVVNMVSYDIVQQMSLASTDYAEGVDEFVKSGLTPIPSDTVKPFRVSESPVQFECKVMEVKELGANGGAGNLVICEITCIHVSDDILDENGKIDPKKLDLVGRCGGNYYTRSAQALFEVAKPIARMGMGVDQIPEDIRLSKVLTGNHLGQLGNVEELPNETDVNEHKLVELADLFMEFEDDASTLEQRLHQLAAEQLDAGDVDAAWMTLLSFNNG
ncbi:MAG: flavin reductase family protein [Flavobacteriales bacterium]|nr:flavin reductase family protein [Flavobacteriales bacterium]